MTSSVLNPWRLEYFFKTYGYTAVYSSNIGLDEFFFISGMLTTLKLMAYLEENGHKLTVSNYLKIFLGRFARLAPVMYAVFLVGWQVGPKFGSGPCWYTYEKGFNNCNQYWWSVFTMTINFFPSYVIANEGCFFWGWYPACDI